MTPLAANMLNAAGSAEPDAIVQACEEIELYLFAEDEAHEELAARANAEASAEAAAQEKGHAAYLQQLAEEDVGRHGL